MKTGKCGGTLVEVMVAIVVLMVIAVAGGAYVAQSSGTLALHRSRAVAVAMANSRLEELRADGFASLTQQMGIATSMNLVTNNTTVSLAYWPVPELVAAGLGTGRDALTLTVSVGNQPPYVSLTTIVSP